MINVPQSNVNYVTNLSNYKPCMFRSRQTSLCQEDLYEHGQKKRILGNICLFFADKYTSQVA